MSRPLQLLSSILCIIVSGCSQNANCRNLTPAQSVSLAIEQKGQMLERSTQAYRRNFASDVARLAGDSTGWVAKVYFEGKDGRTLIAMIDTDCYVSWSER